MKEKKKKKEIYVLQVAVQRLASPEMEKEYNNETKTGLYFYSFFGVSSCHPHVFDDGLSSSTITCHRTVIFYSEKKKKTSCSLIPARCDNRLEIQIEIQTAENLASVIKR